MRSARRQALTIAATLVSGGSVILAMTAGSAAAAGPPGSPLLARGTVAGHVHLMTLARDGLPTQNRLPLVGGAPVGLPLQYGGGNVELTNTNYAIFWEPSGHTVSPTYNALISRWFDDVGGSALFGTTTQYYQTVNGPQQNIENVSSFGGSWLDTAPYPDANLTDADVQAEVVKALKANGWPTGIGNEFFVYTALGAITISNYCAYHGDFALNGSAVLYANEPYGGQSGCTVPSSPNGDPAADSAIDTTSHEQWETITDPTVGGGWTAADGDEGSDQCNFEFGPTDSSGADVVLHGHPYLVQEEWSNAAEPLGCVMS
ncbi:MAG TPA: hypothetical protein VNE21_05095 [Mycobacteriales bacterium]|nr:hypothetical protein [Mycobacteriales bacterium]